MTDLLDTRQGVATVIPAADTSVAMQPINAVTPGALLNVITEMARTPGFDPGVLHSLADLQSKLEDRQAIRLFNEAFLRLQQRLPRVKKNGEVWYPKDKNKPDGPKYRAFKFATWDDIEEVCGPIWREEGFTYSVTSDVKQDGGVLMTGRLCHIGGHERSSSMALPLDTSGGKNNLQGAGSAGTYAQRHIGVKLIGIVIEGEDNDADTGDRKITEAEGLAIEDMIRRAGTDRAKFMNHYKIASILDMTAEQLPHAKKALSGRLAERAVAP